MYVNQYFSHSVVPQKKNKVFVVVEHYSAEHQKTIGVFTGTETVCVFNTGMGMNGDIRKYIESILGTDKTIECVCLTGQPEDVGAVSLFDAAYISDPQLEVYRRVGSNTQERKNLFARYSAQNAESLEYGEMLMLDNATVSFKRAGNAIALPEPGNSGRAATPAGEGYSFHLGGTVVEMAELPAQFDGQLVALSPTCCVVFAGDAIDSTTHLETLDRAGLQRYADCLERVLSYILADSPLSEGMPKTPPAFYCSRSAVPMGEDVPKNILTACREVLAGNTDHDAPAGGRDCLRMHYVENDCIIYDAERIR